MTTPAPDTRTEAVLTYADSMERIKHYETAALLRAILAERDAERSAREAAEQERDMWMRQAATAQDAQEAAEQRMETYRTYARSDAANIQDLHAGIGAAEQRVTVVEAERDHARSQTERQRQRAEAAEARVKELEAQVAEWKDWAIGRITGTRG